jgi:hypothetical protein
MPAEELTPDFGIVADRKACIYLVYIYISHYNSIVVSLPMAILITTVGTCK